MLHTIEDPDYRPTAADAEGLERLPQRPDVTAAAGITAADFLRGCIERCATDPDHPF